MNCPYCNKEAKWCENKEIYGKNYGKSYMCYLCKDCDAYVGCHQNTVRPLGTMANKELRMWRRKVHAYIDPLWLSKKIKRGKLYNKISDLVGFPFHVGDADIETCQRILKIRFNFVAK